MLIKYKCNLPRLRCEIAEQPEHQNLAEFVQPTLSPSISISLIERQKIMN